MNINYIFNSRETYLVARASWKAAYLQLTLEARAARTAFNVASAAFSKAGHYQYGAGAEANQNYTATYKAMDAARCNRAQIRRFANEALTELVEMKKEAASQWMASHLAVA